MELDEAVQDVERGKACICGMISLGTWLPSVQVVPRQLIFLVLARVEFCREKLRGEHCHFPVRSGEVVVSGLVDGVVQRLPVAVSIP